MRKSDQDAKQLAKAVDASRKWLSDAARKNCGCLNQVFAVQAYYWRLLDTRLSEQYAITREKQAAR